MAVDNTLRYRGFNSYELAPNETLYSSLSDCEYFGFVTTQWVALKAGGTIGSGSVRITWIDHTGGQFGSAELYEFTPTRLWERYTWTIAVPPEAVKLRIQFDGGVRGYHFACPMTEPGKIASSFDPNIASAVAYMTSEGAYVGFLNAEQIVAGLLRAVNGGAWFDLDKPEIVMEGELADLSITPENPLKLTDKQGNFIGGLGMFEGLLGLVAGVLTNDSSMANTLTVGLIDGGSEYYGKGIRFKDSENKTGFTINTDTVGVYISDINDKLRVSLQSVLHNSTTLYDGLGNIRLDLGQGATIWDREGNPRLRIAENGGTFFADKNGVDRLTIGDNTYLYDKDNALRLWIEDHTYLYDKNGVIRLWIDPSGNTFMQNAVNSHAIGVDGSGPYFTKSGDKSYLDTLFNATAITWNSTDRVWHDKPSGFYRTTGTGTDLGYPSSYMLILHIVAGSIVWNFAIESTSIWFRRFNTSQSMDWKTP